MIYFKERLQLNESLHWQHTAGTTETNISLRHWLSGIQITPQLHFIKM